MVLWALRAPRELSLASLPGIAFGERRAAHDAERERGLASRISQRRGHHEAGGCPRVTSPGLMDGHGHSLTPGSMPSVRALDGSSQGTALLVARHDRSHDRAWPSQEGFLSGLAKGTPAVTCRLGRDRAWPVLEDHLACAGRSRGLYRIDNRTASTLRDGIARMMRGRVFPACDLHGSTSGWTRSRSQPVATEQRAGARPPRWPRACSRADLAAFA
jgi:hypothetical protein